MASVVKIAVDELPSAASPQHYVLTSLWNGWTLVEYPAPSPTRYTIWERRGNPHFRSRPIAFRTVACLLRDGWIERVDLKWTNDIFTLTAKARKAFEELFNRW